MKARFFFLSIAIMANAIMANATELIKQSGWYESAYVTWSTEAGAGYNVYVKFKGDTQWTQLDKELVRNYGSYGRADALGLKAGSYLMKVVPVKSGAEVDAEAAITDELIVVAHDRAGFAHQDIESVGAYNNDGTLKDGAIVLYVYADNAKTIKATIQKDAPTECVGLQAIIAALEKGKETRPIDIRIIGTIKKADMDALGSSAEGLQVKGNKKTNNQLTIEGVGEDATIHGFGILCRNMVGVEFRNFGILLCIDDCLSLDTANKNIWIHNMDFFYGGTGGDADQAKGDGVVDVKGQSTNITVSYNHFWDTGKSSLGGMKSETVDCLLTYHHNWFDHSDSRHPRIRTMWFHIYNNYFDGNAKYGVGMTMGGSAFVERNYFRNCKYPMLISKQGTDATGDGTFSGEAGGVIKSYDNYIFNPKRMYIHPASTGMGKDQHGQKDYVKGTETDWDTYEVASPEEEVPASVTAVSGGTPYKNRTIPYTYHADAAADVKSEVIGEMGAGRMNHGDFQWQFNNATQDENYDVITELKTAIINYQSKLVGWFDSSLPKNVKNGGFTGEYPTGDKDKNEGYVATYGGSGDDPDDDDAEPYIVGENNDYYYFLAVNHDKTAAYMADGIIAASEGYNLLETPNESDKEKYGIQIKEASGTMTVYCEEGIENVYYLLYRTGSLKGEFKAGNSLSSLKAVGKYDGSKGVNKKAISLSDSPKYVQITNTATGTLYIQGIKVFKTASDKPEAIETVTISEPKAIKRLENGQVVIIRDGIRYNVMGARLN